MTSLFAAGINISHTAFARLVLNDRRAATTITVDQIHQMAEAILELDQLVEDAQKTARAIRGPKNNFTKCSTPTEVGMDQALKAALANLVEAKASLDRETFGPNENLAQQKFEKAAHAVVDALTNERKNQHA